MDSQSLLDLNEIRNELDISKETFNLIIKMALEYKKSNNYISNEELVDIISETMMLFDYNDSISKNDEYTREDQKNFDTLYGKRKSLRETFHSALCKLGYEDKTNFK